ncbi:hypothetical protein GCK72_013131 [Caenorhabditis remanei]|uniref:Uncharacterized protein n=1 Tax=Caenorhabditis remanei TaxID=31234 RepID=A0A6A5GMY4_CAERE|nr:hypothetical protein GCK72_013131 [Caenorhabditis remanei]KAF1756677.1 hypothetical protein GCK72_013131 [Caenorhabditis remanei]
MNSLLIVLLGASVFYCANAQYGGQAYSPPAYSPPVYAAPPQQYYPPPPQPMNDNYVCSIQANYPLFGQHGKHHRPTTNFCQDAYKSDSCDRCCKIAARIQGTTIKEESIVGFNMILEKQPFCVCCSPTSSSPTSNY